MVGLMVSLALWSTFIVQLTIVHQQFSVCSPRLQVNMVCHPAAGVTRVLVALYMLSQQGTDRGSMLVGRSVHNQRIER